MNAVVYLQDRQAKESIAVLEHLLDEARQGKIEGLALAVKPSHGPVDIIFTDLYRRQPARAASSAMRMSIRLNELQEALDERQFG